MKSVKNKNTSYYSRNGCLPCKKSHAKCDEKKPICEKCSKKGKNCTYHLNFINTSYTNKTVLPNGNTVDRNLSSIPPSTSSSVQKGTKKKVVLPKIMITTPLNIIPSFPKNQISVTITNSALSKKLGNVSTLMKNCLETQDVPTISSTPGTATLTFTSTPTATSHSVSFSPSPTLPRNADISIDSLSPSLSNGVHHSNTAVSNRSPHTNGSTESPETAFNIPLKTKPLGSDVFFPQTNLQIFNLLNFDKIHSSTTLIYSSAENRVNFPSRASSWESVISIISELDPINKYYSSRLPNSSTKDISYIPIDDANFLEFIWTVCDITFCVGQFALYPKQLFKELMSMFRCLDEDYPIIHSVMRYSVADFMKDMYHKQNLNDLSGLWDTFVRIPSMKPCIDIMNKRIDACDDYIECNALAFSVGLLFSPHSTGLNSDWRSHLSGLYGLLKKASTLFKDEILTTEKGRYAFAFFGITNAIFCRTEVCASISADNGGFLTSVDELDIVYNVEPFPTFHLLAGKYDLSICCVTTIYPVCKQITSELIRWKQKGIHLSGTNFIKFKLTNRNREIKRNLFQFGLAMLSQLDLASSDTDAIEALKTVDDYKLRFTIEKCNQLDIHALKIYLRVFFLHNDESNLAEIRNIVEAILESWYGLPYANIVVVKCHWAIYYGALSSIVIKEKNLIKHFFKILDGMAMRGLDLAVDSARKLRHIYNVLKTEEYDKLIESHDDFIVY